MAVNQTAEVAAELPATRYADAVASFILKSLFSSSSAKVVKLCCSVVSDSAIFVRVFYQQIEELI